MTSSLRPVNCPTPGSSVLHYLPEFAQTHVHWVDDASNQLILWHPFLLLASIFPSIQVFSNEMALCITRPKYWSFSMSPSNEYSELISFRIDWLDLLAVQGVLKGFSRTKEHLGNTIPQSGNFLGEPRPSAMALPLLFVAHLHPGWWRDCFIPDGDLDCLTWGLLDGKEACNDWMSILHQSPTHTIPHN